MDKNTFFKAAELSVLFAFSVVLFVFLFDFFGASKNLSQYAFLFPISAVAVVIIVVHLFLSYSHHAKKTGLEFFAKKQSIFESSLKEKELHTEIRQLKKVKQSLKRELARGKLSERNYHSYEQAATRAMIKAEEKLRLAKNAKNK
ncbi:MAG: hypothetical protein ACE5DI_03420 [Candidatus Micrarchaeia archaeon]